MSKCHTGKYLAQGVEALVKSFGIEKKVCVPLNIYLETNKRLQQDLGCCVWQCIKQRHYDQVA